MSPRLHVVFDGRCGFCTRSVGWVRRLDRHGRIELHAWQEPGVLERFGLTPEQGDTSVWAIPARCGAEAPARGSAHSGARAVAAILDTALGTRCFGALYDLPLVGRVQEGIYRWVAAHRGGFPGVTPWCEQHPGRCGSGHCGSV
ncbi:thiol-disulfide oxidoreductase DCC family protein, partial [Kocuria sp.]|uniref:thiol-disulfide oxidoreductase DCC family protein n=1 Tax=Kocuria sp. TaxID=1871328 RepID=UPI0026DBD030